MSKYLKHLPLSVTEESLTPEDIAIVLSSDEELEEMASTTEMPAPVID